MWGVWMIDVQTSCGRLERLASGDVRRAGCGLCGRGLEMRAWCMCVPLEADGDGSWTSGTGRTNG